MTKTRMTIAKEILIEQSRDVIDVIMRIGGGLMPRTMLATISELPQYKNKKLLSQLKPLIKKQSHIMRDNKTIKKYPPFLTSTRLENYVVYTISLANARLVNPGVSYTQPSLDTNALVRRMQLIHHRISILRNNPNLTFDQLATIDSGFLSKQELPGYLSGIAQRVNDGSARLLVKEAQYTQNALDRMAGGRRGDLPAKIDRDNAFVVLGSPTILALHQMGVYVQLINHDNYRIYIYEGRNLRDISDIIKLVGSATAYFGTLLPNNYHCKEVSIRTVNRDDFHKLAKMLSAKKSEVQKIKATNGIGKMNAGPTNVFDDYFGGIML